MQAVWVRQTPLYFQMNDPHLRREIISSPMIFFSELSQIAYPDQAFGDPCGLIPVPTLCCHSKNWEPWAGSSVLYPQLRSTACPIAVLCSNKLALFLIVVCFCSWTEVFLKPELCLLRWRLQTSTGGYVSVNTVWDWATCWDWMSNIPLEAIFWSQNTHEPVSF